MRKHFVFVVIMLTFVSARAENKDLCARAETNPGVIRCNQQQLQVLDKKLASLVAEIKNKKLSGTDAHARNLADYQKLIDEEIQSFKNYRNSAGNVSAVVEGGTGSDMMVVSTSEQVRLTLAEIARLEKLAKD